MAKPKGADVEPRKSAVPPCLISNTVREYLLAQDLSPEARSAVEGAVWQDERQCWVMDCPPFSTLNELAEVAVPPGSDG